MDRLIESTVVLALMFFVAISFILIDKPYNMREDIQQASFAPPQKSLVQKAKLIRQNR